MKRSGFIKALMGAPFLPSAVAAVIVAPALPYAAGLPMVTRMHYDTSGGVYRFTREVDTDRHGHCVSIGEEKRERLA